MDLAERAIIKSNSVQFKAPVDAQREVGGLERIDAPPDVVGAAFAR